MNFLSLFLRFGSLASIHLRYMVMDSSKRETMIKDRQQLLGVSQHGCRGRATSLQVTRAASRCFNTHR